ncbi:MAG: anti-sigma factor family protein [Anaeromyxobacteraceae bacterium]
MLPPVHPMFTCAATADRLSDYIDGELPPVLLLIVELHLAGCPHCSRFAREMMETVRALRALRPTRTPS